MTFQYFNKMAELLATVEKEEKDAMLKARDILVEATEKKRSIYIFGASHAGILAQEMYYRAGGLMTINPIFGRELMLDNEPITLTSQMERLVGYGTVLAKKVNFKADDVLILHSVSGRNPVTIEMGMVAQEKGVNVISLTNLTYSKGTTSRHPSGKKLYDVSDVVIDNHGAIGDATCTIEGIDQKVAPSSTVVGATILNAIVVEVCQKLVDRGMKYPPIFYSANLDGGDALNQALYEKYKDSIHYRF